MEQMPITERVRFNPYTLPLEQQGWRGLGLPPEVRAHRRAFTLFWNEQALVMALLTFPGERTIRHSHESGELGISFTDALHPTVSYQPGGQLHAGIAEARTDADPLAFADEVLKTVGSPEVRELLERMLEEQRRMQKVIEELQTPIAGPRIGIEVLFPPFRTTIDDPAYPEPKVIVGPWFD
jgi:hypothetical protein